MATTATQKRKDSSGTKPEGTAATDAAPAAKRLPVKTLRVADCSASIWAREYVAQGQPRTFYSFSLERSYKDRDGGWKYTKSFDSDSAGAVAALCQQASEVIAALQERDDQTQAA
ncbi:MAG TPA: hypothetical protein VD866_16010 [Urbifossiella sp.]|nr:hypothetical protein [Urbifossiella sp.]